MRYLTIALTLAILVPACSRSKQPVQAQTRPMEIRRLPPEEFAKAIKDSNRLLVNVERAPKGEIPGTKLLLREDRALESLEVVQPDMTRPLAIYCGQGKRSDSLATQLARAGYSNICVLSGGYRSWVEKGLPFRVYGPQK